MIATLAVLALAPAARAADVAIVSRDVPLRAGARSLALAPPRFNMVALHWQGPGTPLFRVRTIGGRWTAWQAADDDWGRTGPWRMQGSPDWTGPADRIRYRLRGRVTRLRVYFLWSPAVQQPLRRLSIAGSPAIISRFSWQADESIRRAPPLYARTLRFAIVHHTANSNDYRAAQSASIVRGIEVYHVKGNGWNDIGYNFLVDKYGRIFEGRYGGIDRNVVGAHSLGFNTGSVGIAVIGSYGGSPISTAAKTAVEQLLAWRLDLAHVDPLSTLSFISGGNQKFPAGIPAFLRAISGHRDTYFTDCPGDALYAQLPSIAADVAAIGLPKLYAPTVTGKIGGQVRFTGRLSSALPWTVTVIDLTGEVVASGSGSASAVDYTWDATAAPAGTYSWTIAAGPTVRPAGGTIAAKPQPLALTAVAATPTTISPNGDGVDDTSTVAYTLGTGATVTATLVDAAGATVTTLFSEPKAAGRQSFVFSAGDTVPDGAYTIVLTARTADGQQAKASATIEVDRTVVKFAATPASFSPNGDGVQDAVGFEFTLGRTGPARLEVTQKNGATVATLLSGTYPAGSPVAAEWDGTSAGALLPDGAYTAKLTVGTLVRSLALVLDTRPPVLRPLSWSGLRFRVAEAATVTLAAAGRRYRKTLKAAGPLYFWLKRRPRTFTVVARDAAGNATTLRRRD
ncbi:MAG: FlgD immunoglobulin-like domain containing protein [Gaiellaceae bacterium]